MIAVCLRSCSESRLIQQHLNDRRSFIFIVSKKKFTTAAKIKNYRSLEAHTFLVLSCWHPRKDGEQETVMDLCFFFCFTTCCRAAFSCFSHRVKLWSFPQKETRPSDVYDILLHHRVQINKTIEYYLLMNKYLQNNDSPINISWSLLCV